MSELMQLARRSLLIVNINIRNRPGIRRLSTVRQTTALDGAGIHYYIRVRRVAYSACLALILLVLAALNACYTGSRPPRIGSAAPDFTVQDSDRSVKLSDYRGQIVVLNFWATWCPPCVEEMPSLVEMQRRMKAKGITVVAVSVDVDQGAYNQFVKEHNVNLLTVRDAGQKSNALYGTFKFPETYIIDRNGVMRRKFLGAVDWTAPDIDEFLSKL
jgi:cytochrome c biogenesis protein CcmG, thiol:disulfide interchange protein DsbE